MSCFFSDPALWRNVLTGIILLLLGFVAFVGRIEYTNKRRREKLINALHAEIGEMRVVDDSYMSVLKGLIHNGERPFITADSSYPIFSGHQNELSLLDKETLSAVTKLYTLDGFLSKTLLRFQDDQFLELDKKRKEQALENFEKMNTTLVQYRKNALTLLSS